MNRNPEGEREREGKEKSEKYPRRKGAQKGFDGVYFGGGKLDFRFADNSPRLHARGE